MDEELRTAALRLVSGISPTALKRPHTRPGVSTTDLARLVRVMDSIMPGAIDEVRRQAGVDPLKR
jgi:hypothetical protein